MSKYKFSILKIDDEIRFMRDYLLTGLLIEKNKGFFYQPQKSITSPNFYIKDNFLYFVVTDSYNILNGSTNGNNDIKPLEKLINAIIAYFSSSYNGKSISEVILLFTNDYWQKHFKTINDIEYMKNIIQRLNQARGSFGEMICCKRLDIWEKEVDECIFNLINNEKLKWQNLTLKTDKIKRYKANIDLEKHFNYFKNIEDKLFIDDKTFTIKIYGGHNQIGGNCVVIENEKDRLILDMGLALTDEFNNSLNIDLKAKDLKKYLPDIEDLYGDNPKKNTAIFLSHAHPDHFGLLRFINKNIPILATKETVEIMKKGSILLWDNLYDDVNLIPVRKFAKIGAFNVELCPVNHSVAGSCAFKIEDRKSHRKILYTGDLRLHGRDNDLFKTKSMMMNFRNCDYLITEGTNLSREGHKYETENEIEQKLAEFFKEEKMNIIACSPLNIDRIISIYNACLAADKIFVIDPYTAFILDTFKEKDIPKYNSKNVKVYFVGNNQTKKLKEDGTLYHYKGSKIPFEEIMKNPQKYVVKNNSKIFDSIIKRINIKELNLIYSYWSGYLEDENYQWAKYKEQLEIVHTSGHIVEDDLVKFVDKIKPKNIIPIHTTATDRFLELFKNKYNIVLDTVI